jgi:hypothetical protein
VELDRNLDLFKTSNALLSDVEYGEFQRELAANPGRGALIKVVGAYARFGLRSVRGASAEGAGVIYYWAVRKDLIMLLFMYLKRAVY